MSGILSLGGYPADWFVEKPDDNFMCGICYDVLKDPHQCKNGHNFCLSCVSEALKHNRECPSCKVPVTVDGLNVQLLARNLINKFHVKCSNATCQWVGPLENLDPHRSACEKQQVDCQLHKYNCCTSKCNGKVLRGAVAEHLIEAQTIHSAQVFPKLLSKIEDQDRELSFIHQAVVIGYVGERKNYLRDGVGFERFPDNTFYAGNYKLDKMEGYGVLTRPKSKYTGNFHNNRPHGSGTMTYSNGASYVGEWINGLHHGHGTFTGVKGDIYVGNWVADKRCGIGKQTFDSGASYDGEWKDNAFCGRGLDIRSNGTIVEAIFKNSIIEDGHVKLSHKDGSIYEGDVITPTGMNVLHYHGYGRMQYTNGDVYEGMWESNVKHGAGKYTSKSTGNVFEAQWVKHAHASNGKVRYRDGSVYEGEVKQGMLTRHGHGKMTYTNGTVQEGIWVMGRFQNKPPTAVRQSASASTDVVDLTATPPEDDTGVATGAGSMRPTTRKRDREESGLDEGPETVVSTESTVSSSSHTGTAPAAVAAAVSSRTRRGRTQLK